MPFTLQDYFTQANTRIVDSSNGTLTKANITLFLNEALRRARRHMSLPTQRYITPMLLMSGIYEYALPTGYEDYVAITGPGIVPDQYDFYRVEREADFWRRFLNINSFSEQRNGQIRSALINLVNPSLVVANVTQASIQNGAGQGTWVADTATSDATNVRTNTLLFKVGTGSISFDIDVSQSINDYAQIENSTLTAVDLSGTKIANVGMLTAFVYLPSVSTQYTSFTMRWGSSPTDYYEKTVTTQINNGTFQQGWNTLGFDWGTATTTGTPNNSAIDYVMFRATFPSSMTDQSGVLLNGVYMREQRLVNFHYISDYLVTDGASGSLKEYFTDEDDTSSYFNCDGEFIDWLTYDLMENVFAMYDIDPQKREFHKIRREKLEEDLMESFASQREIPVTAYMENDQLQNFLN